jgi:hypothetical protein
METRFSRTERIATRYRKSFFEHIVNPHLDAGMSGPAPSEVAAKVALLRSLSVRRVSILLARAIERGGAAVTPRARRYI